MGKASVLIVLSDSIIQGRLSLFQFKFQNLHKIFYALEKYYHNWQNSIWLKGMIALPLDRNLKISFNGWQVQYSRTLGLMYEKDGEDE